MTETIPAAREYLTVNVCGQLFGVSVMTVNDVLGPQKMTRALLAPPAIVGIMNLRGRIVTAIDMRRCLALPERTPSDPSMSVVVERGGELFSLIIDKVGDVILLDHEKNEDMPVTLDERWRSVGLGISKLNSEILVLLDISKLLEIAMHNTASKKESVSFNAA